MTGIPEDDEMLPSCVEDVRASIDLDGDGDITKEEFVKNALKNDFISKLLKYENSCQWIIENPVELFLYLIENRNIVHWCTIDRGAAKND